MRFVHSPEFVSVAFKADGFSGNLGALGGALPNGVLVACSVDVQARHWDFWLYDDEGRTYALRLNFASIPIEDGGPDAIRHIDVTGSPSVVAHTTGGMTVIKVMYAQYFEGAKAEQLYRLNTGWALVP